MNIGIIGAMQEEVSLLKEYMDGNDSCELGKQKFLTGKIKNHNITLLQCGVGKVSAAVGTTLLNQLFNPDIIINIGSAGALGSSFNIGDIIISSEVRYHDVDLTVFGYEFGQMSKMPPYFTPGETLVVAATKCLPEEDQCHIKNALVISGDSFVSNKTHIANIKEKFAQDCVIDMEGCAIAQVCYMFNKPFIIIRSVSDIVEHENNNETFEKFLSMTVKRTTGFILNMLDQL
jgi:adenosylhomocysteine nucleosidase